MQAKLLSSENNPLLTPKALKLFFMWAGILFALRVALLFIRVPISAVLAANSLVTVAIMTCSFFALYQGARHDWKAALGWIFLGAGVLIHIGTALLTRSMEPSLMSGILLAVGQTGVLAWCLGLGALLSILIKEKNLLLPVAIFLAGFDAFIILNPTSATAEKIAKNVETVGAIGMSIPSVSTSAQPVGAPLQDLAYVGPADLFFAAAFFCLMIRHQMKARQTALILIPVLLAYLVLVFFTGVPLPALVPIGAVILIVNWNEFKMTVQEKWMTISVAVIALGLAGYGLFRFLTVEPEAPSESSTTQGVPGPPTQGGSPQQEPGD